LALWKNKKINVFALTLNKKMAYDGIKNPVSQKRGGVFLLVHSE
jgi:hypothetical protein